MRDTERQMSCQSRHRWTEGFSLALTCLCPGQEGINPLKTRPSLFSSLMVSRGNTLKIEEGCLSSHDDFGLNFLYSKGKKKKTLNKIKHSIKALIQRSKTSLFCIMGLHS